MPSPNLREIPRDQLFRVFKDEDLVRLFEEILRTLNETLPADTTAVEAALADHIADTVDAHEASAIGATPGGTRPSNTAQGQLADLDSSKLNASAVGTMAAQNANNVSITGGTVALASGSLGYAAGNGGTVTQATSKSTGATLNKISGEITMDGAALAGGAIVSFVLTNSAAAAKDVVVRNHVSGGTIGAYSIEAAAAAGSITFYVRNNTGGSLSEAIVIRFAVVKAATT